MGWEIRYAGMVLVLHAGLFVYSKTVFKYLIKSDMSIE